jgi:hypothetical protein
MYSWVGDPMENLELVLYCDADLAGDRTDCKSTSGIFMAIVGSHTFVPLAGISKKQTSVSKSTPEAEIVAIDHGLCKEGLPALSLWETLLKKRMKIRLMEDNSAACRVLITGRNPSMRHMSRTQRIDVAWLNERYVAGDFVFVECPSEFQGGDIFTKHCIDAIVWSRNLMLIAHFTRDQLIRAGSHDVCPVQIDNGPVYDQGGTSAPSTMSHGFLAISQVDPRTRPLHEIASLIASEPDNRCYKFIKQHARIILVLTIDNHVEKQSLPMLLKHFHRMAKIVIKNKGSILVQIHHDCKRILARGDMLQLINSFCLQDIGNGLYSCESVPVTQHAEIPSIDDVIHLIAENWKAESQALMRQ